MCWNTFVEVINLNFVFNVFAVSTPQNAFNVQKKIKDNGDIVHVFPAQKQCNYVSGDLAYETLQADTAYVLSQAKKQLRTDNIEFV